MSAPSALRRRLIGLAGYGLIVAALPALLAALEIGGWFALGARGAARYPMFYTRPEGPSAKVLAEEPWFQLIDPQLSHAYAPEFLAGRLPGLTIVPGFVAYADPDTNPDAIRIFALGGSTTDPNFRECWPYQLQKKLDALGLNAIVYNGGVAGYSTNQELLKLVRDVFPLKPDIVLALSGVNDQGFAHSDKRHPMIHPYQAKVFGSLAGRREPSRFLPNAVELLRSLAAPIRPGDVRATFGLEVQTTPGAQWERNVRLMHAMCEELGVHYLCFRQPVLGVGQYAPSAEETAFLDQYSSAVRLPGEGPAYLDALRAFYDETQIVPQRLPYCVDGVDLFAGKQGMYRDARHQTSAGAAVIADAAVAEMQRRGMISAGAALKTNP